MVKKNINILPEIDSELSVKAVGFLRTAVIMSVAFKKLMRNSTDI